MALVFAYGSLVNAKSRARTLHPSAAVPACVRGVRRSWCVRASDIGATSLGLTLEPNSWCNGVLLSVATAELSALDERERQYQRVALDVGCIDAERPLCGSERVLTYVANEVIAPDDEHPILQSYLDVALSGFLDIGVRAAAEFVAQTEGWRGAWLDDRVAPRYPIQESSHPSVVLDALLQRCLGGGLSCRART